MILAPPVRPWRGFRDTDLYGSGVFGASRDGGARPHPGWDCITVPGDMITPIFPSRVARLGYAYEDDRALRLVEMCGLGEWDGWACTIMYVSPTVVIGSIVDPSVPIGIAADLAAYYRRKHPKAVKDITNHIHVEVAQPIDWSRLLPAGLKPEVTA